MRMGNTYKGAFMLTTDSLIAVISLCAAMFAIGYAIGKDSK